MRNVSNNYSNYNYSKYTGPHPLLIGISRALEFTGFHQGQGLQDKISFNMTWILFW